jgi:hypothetical protein
MCPAERRGLTDGDSAPDLRVLELVDLGVVFQEVEHPIDGAGRQGSVTVGTGHEPDEDGLISGNEGGNAEYIEGVGDAGVLVADDGSRPSRVDLGEDGVGVGATTTERADDDVSVSQVVGVVVAGAEEGVMDGAEFVGEPVTDHDSRGQGQEVGLVGGIVPSRGSTLFDVGLVQEERHEPDIPAGTFGEPGEEVLVGITGEGTAIIPGHSKCALRCHALSTPGGGRSFRCSG